MTKLNPPRALAAGLCAGLVSLLCLVPVASAQIDNGGFQIFQDDELAGLVWVPEGAGARCQQQQIWYLFPSYVHPGQEQAVETVLAVDPELTFDDEEGFRAAMEAEYPGGQFVAVTAVAERADCR